MIPSLVFPALLDGRYERHEKGTQAARQTLDVRGSEVTTEAWLT